jgi:hypothetical protein
MFEAENSAADHPGGKERKGYTLNNWEVARREKRAERIIARCRSKNALLPVGRKQISENTGWLWIRIDMTDRLASRLLHTATPDIRQDARFGFMLR